MRRFANDTRFEHITTIDFLELVNEVTGQDYTEWFDRELFGL